MVRSLLAVVILLVAASLEYAIDAKSASAGLFHLLVALAACVALVAVLRGRARDTALVFASLFLGLTAVEGWFRHLEKPSVEWEDGGAGALRADIGYGAAKPGVYRMRATLPGNVTVFDVTVTIGDDLLRVSTAPKGPGALDFFGDSFTFGAGVEDKDTIVQATSDLMHGAVPMLNVSYNGWSPANLLAILQHGLYDDELRGARHFVMMTAPWHMDRTSCIAAWVRNVPRYVVGKDGKLVQDGVCPAPAHGALHDFLHGFAFVRQRIEPRMHRITPADGANYFAIVDAFVAMAKAKYGVDTTILAVPNPFYLSQIGLTEKDYEERLARSGADVLMDPLPLAGKPDNPYVIPNEVHPTPLANRFKAKLLVDRLEKTHPGLLPKGDSTTASTVP